MSSALPPAVHKLALLVNRVVDVIDSFDDIDSSLFASSANSAQLPQLDNASPALRLHVRCCMGPIRYVWVGVPTFLGLFIGTTFARAP